MKNHMHFAIQLFCTPLQNLGFLVLQCYHEKLNKLMTMPLHLLLCCPPVIFRTLSKLISSTHFVAFVNRKEETVKAILNLTSDIQALHE